MIGRRYQCMPRPSNIEHCADTHGLIIRERIVPFIIGIVHVVFIHIPVIVRKSEISFVARINKAGRRVKDNSSICIGWSIAAKISVLIASVRAGSSVLYAPTAERLQRIGLE